MIFIDLVSRKGKAISSVLCPSVRLFVPTSTLSFEPSSSSSCGLSMNGRCRLHKRPPCRKLIHGKHFSWYVPGNSPGKCEQLGWPKTSGIAWYLPWGPQHVQQVELFSGGLHSPRHGSCMGKWGYFMTVVCATRLPHPRPGRVVAVVLWLLIRQGKTLLISQLTSISRGRSTIHRPVDAGGSSYSSASPEPD